MVKIRDCTTQRLCGSFTQKLESWLRTKAWILKQASCLKNENCSSFRSIALWIIKDYSGSLNTLVTPNVGELHPKFTEEEATERTLKKKLEADPSVFNFYVYLR